MTQQSELPLDETPDYQQPTDIPGNTAEVNTVVEEERVEATEPTPSPSPEPVSEAASPEPVTDNTDIETQRAELERQRLEYEQAQQRDRMIQGLEQEALQMEQQLLNQGLTEEDAKQQTMGHLQNRVGQIQQAQQAKLSADMAQGKRNASIHFAKKYNLGLDDLGRLERANDPKQMEQIAKDISAMAAKDKEIAELKARLNPQQTFDSNTPTPAAATNEDRLLDAYLNGDRSEAATAAAAKLLGI